MDVCVRGLNISHWQQMAIPNCPKRHVVFQTPEIKWSNAIEGTLFLTKSNRSTAQCFPGNNGDSTS